MMKVILFIGSLLSFTGHTQASVKIFPELDKLYVLESAPLTLNCVYVFPTSEGDGEPVAFYKESERIAFSNTLRFQITERRKITGPNTTVTISIMKDNTVQTDRGVYECKLGVSTTYTDITVEIFSVVGTNDTLMKDAKTATLGCTVNGVGIGVDLQMTWRHKSKSLTSGDKYQINATTGILEIINPVREDMGEYYCKLTFDPTSARNSQQVYPKTVVLLASPMIDKHDNTKKMIQGDELELKCKVSGSPAPDVKWLKDDSPIIETNRIRFLKYEEIAKIKIYELKLEDEAVYTCFASNEVPPFNATAEMQVRVKAYTWTTVERGEDYVRLTFDSKYIKYSRWECHVQYMYMSDNTNYWLTLEDDVKSPNIQLNNLSPDSQYRVRVKIKDTLYLLYDFSPEISFTTKPAEKSTLQRDTILVSVFATLIVCLVLAIVGCICYRKRTRSSNDSFQSYLDKDTGMQIIMKNTP